jgi:glycosyltransferase involved in cell wall biosynthesis
MRDASIIIALTKFSDVFSLVVSSLNKQTFFKNRFEVIIADSSKKNNLTAIKKISKFKLKYLHLVGQSRAVLLNKAVEASAGSILIFLEENTVPESNFLEEHIKCHRWHKRSVVVGYIRQFGEEYTRKDSVTDAREKLFKESHDNLMCLSGPWDYFKCNNFSVNRRWMASLDENYQDREFEDVDLGVMFANQGLTFQLHRYAVAYQQQGHVSSSAKPRKILENIYCLAGKSNNSELMRYLWGHYHKLPLKYKKIGEISVGITSNALPFYDNNELSYDKNNSEIKRELNYWKCSLCDRVVFRGGEPALREDIFDLIGYAQTLGMSLILETNGRIFSYNDFAEKIVKGAVHEFIIDFWAHDELLSDFLTRDEGGFQQSLQGIRNLLNLRAKLSVRLHIVRQNSCFLRKMIEFVADFGIHNIEIIALNTDCNDINRIIYFAKTPSIPYLQELNIWFINVPSAVISKFAKGREPVASDFGFKEERHEKLNIAMLGYPLSILNTEFGGGAERATLQLYEFLKESGASIQLYGRTNRKNRQVIPLNSNDLSYTYKYGEWWNYEEIMQGNLPYFIDFIEKSSRASIMHGMNAPFLAVVSPKPVVIHIHNWCTLPKYQGYLEAYASAHYIFNSHFMKKLFLKKYPDIPEENCFVIWYGINTDMFCPKQKNPSEPVNILYASSWSEHKGIYVLLDAIKLLEKRRRDFIVNLAGSPYLHDFGQNLKYQKDNELVIKSLIKKLKSVKVIGLVPHENLPEVYGNTDIAVFPSLWKEPFGLVNLEAMSCGVPVVASKTGGIPEIVAKDCGILVKPGDAQALAKALERLIENPKLRERMGLSGRKRALKYFNSKGYAEKILKIYDKILNKTSMMQIYENSLS